MPEDLRKKPSRHVVGYLPREDDLVGQIVAWLLARDDERVELAPAPLSRQCPPRVQDGIEQLRAVALALVLGRDEEVTKNPS